MKNIKKCLSYNPKGCLFGFILMTIFYNLIVIAGPIVQKNMINALTDAQKDLALQGLFYLFVLFVCGQLVMYLMDRFYGSCEKHTFMKIQERAKDVILYHDPSKLELSRSKINQQILQNYQKLSNFFTNYPVQLFTNILLEIAILVILFQISSLNAWIVLIFVPFFILISSFYQDRLSTNGQQTNHAINQSTTYLLDLSEISERERFLKHGQFTNFNDLLKTFQQTKDKQVKFEAFFENVLSYAGLNFLIFISMAVSVYQVLQGVISIGDLFAISMYVSKFWGPMEFLVSYFKESYANQNILDEFFAFLDTPQLQTTTSPINTIHLQNYQSLDQNGNPLHQPLTQTFHKNQLYVIQGENGSGKTTLALSILGLTSRYTGVIVYPGFPRNDNFLYSFARPSTSLFLDEKDHPTKRSMGQYKMVQLNFDFAQEKDVYLFDEPTNYLDLQHKKIVRDQIEQLVSKNKIVLVISHDIDFVKASDTIIKLEKI